MSDKIDDIRIPTVFQKDDVIQTYFQRHFLTFLKHPMSYFRLSQKPSAPGGHNHSVGSRSAQNRDVAGHRCVCLCACEREIQSERGREREINKDKATP